MKYLNQSLILITLSFISACGGGGGGGGDQDNAPDLPAPSVNISANPTSVLLTNETTLTWSTTNATSCSASGAWTGAKSTSGTETVTISNPGDNTFTLACTGNNKTSTASTTVEGFRNSDGVAVDGYISGAEIFIDTNEDWVANSNENSTTSDNDGKFTLKYANGNLVSIGGTDLDTQILLDNLLITHKLTGHSDFKAITPVTSVAAFMTEPSKVNAALGIDESIDVFTFDPVANKGDKGINDFLYEKGNQLTVIAYTLQNITNNLNTTSETTQDYFQSIAEEIDTEYNQTDVRVNIEKEAFIEKVLDNIINKKSLTIDNANKANTVSAITAFLPIIQVKENNDNTVAIFNFAVSTFQNDAKSIANGSVTAEVLSSYQNDILNYIASDQNVSAGDLEPDITAFEDSVITDEDVSIDINVLNNDSYLTTSSIIVDIGLPADGTAYLEDNIVTYIPDENFYGTDSIPYNITQGSKTSSSNISIVINSVNDVPTFDNLLSTYRVDENQTAVTSISASDVEEESLTISLGGEDESDFNLSSSNVLTFNEAPDYETKNTYELIVSVTDGIDVLNKDVTVKLNNLNDNVPVFTSDSVLSGDENQRAIGTIIATDADGDSIVYSISGSDIIIDSASGVISFATDPDYETTTFYTATVTATDGLNSTNQDITVNVNNLNDNVPIYTSNASFNADENQTNIGTVTATDADGDALSFSITGSDLLISSSGILTFASAPDYETLTSYSATVTVTDGLNSVAQDITVNVNNLNDNSPIFSSPETFSVEENKSFIGTAVATDADTDSSVTYTIDNSVTQKMEVTVAANTSGSGNVYVISGVQKKSLVLEVGKTYSFSHPTEHPLRFSTTDNGTHGGGSEYTDGVDTSTEGITLITVSSETPSNLYYYCSIHSGMGADVVSSSNSFPVISIASSTGDLTFSPSPDFETLASFSAKITASDGEISTDQDIQVNIIDVEPEGPVFSSSSTFNVDENQTAIGTVSATDPQGSAVTYSISGTDADSITLNTSSGLLIFNSAPDYETKSSYEVTITAIGSISNTEQVLAININNLNDNIPVFDSTASYSGDENQTSIGTIQVTDADGDSLTYSIASSDLLIDSSGVLTFASAPDYETTTSFSGTVSVTDGLYTADQSITVSVNNLNDNSPVITSNATFTAAENQTAIATLTASDADGDSISFTISGSELSITSTGILTFASAPDYETKTSYTATVTASDGTNSGTQDITINISDLDDEAPVITSSDTFSADENQTAIGTVTATDVDTLDTSATISFAISGSELAIDSDGVLTFTSAPDYETKTSYTATVTASDGAGNSSTQDITVNVSDLDDEAPVITSSDTFSADENQTAIGTVTATDVDTLDTSATISFAISGSELAIDSDGVLTFTSAPDYETKTSYTATVTASDGAGNSSTQDITVSVNNLNDNSPVITSNATFTAAENQTAIGTVSASDADGDSISFTISGSELSITSTGILTFASAPDYETKTSYTATVTASDGTNSGTQDITINISDLDDEAPVITSSDTFSADENQTAIGTVTATDVDTLDTSATISFTISGSELSITSTGILTFASAPDYETKTSYTATVTASDGAGNSSTQDITVSVNNLNDNSPVFSSGSSFSADENETAIGTVVSSDADGDDITYSISGSEIAIDSATGVITFTSAPDYETKTSYTATVTASDGTNSTTQDITVGINNLNDNSPVFTSDATFSAAENQTAIGTVTASDADGNPISFEVDGSDLSVSSSGILRFIVAPNYETKSSYSATLTARDASIDGSNFSTQDIVINVTDINDAPVFTSSSTLNGDENQTTIGTITASDEDGDSLNYTITGTQLEITSAGVLTFASAPNYETKSSYTATVSVSDSVVTSTQDITVNVNDVNDAPVATAESYYLNLLPQDQSGGNITLEGTDEDGDTLTYTIVSNGSYGTASFTSQDASQTIEVSVVSSGGGFAYVIDGIQKKSLTLNVGTTYTFTHSDAHPFRFSTTSNGTHGGGSEYTTGVTTSSGSTVIEVTGSTPTTLYYYCSVHSGMGASASMSNTSSNAIVNYTTNASTQSAQSETFTFKVNDGTVDSDSANISIDLRTDPLYQYQWHLNNTGQTNFATNAGTAGQDLNVDSVIVDNYTGNGVKISIGDDGLEIAHEDLVDNIVPGSYDFVNNDNDPTQPSTCPETGSCVGHGTSVAGIIAAKGWNNIGVRGVAPNASIFGDNFLKDSSKYNESRGVNPPGGVTADIYNMSYGIKYPKDDDDVQKSTYSLPTSIKYNFNAAYEDAFINGTTNLRDGKGAIYVKSSGNAYETQSDADCGEGKVLSCTETSIDRNNQSPYIINVAAMNADGIKSSYSTPGSSLWVSGFGGESGFSDIYAGTGDAFEPAIMTVDRSSCTLGNSRSGSSSAYGVNRFDLAGQNFTEQLTLNPDCNYLSSFNGTSSAAPTVSGVIALMLEANSDLTWRDVKHILVTTSDKVDASRTTELNGVTQYSWVENTAGHEHHNWYGFGRVNAAAAVSAAKTYTANSLGSFVTTGIELNSISGTIPDNSGGVVTKEITKPTGSNGIVEFVRVLIDFDHSEPWSVGFRLQSPGGTIINLMQPGTNINNPGYYFDIGVSGFYGESMEGTWTLEVRDYSEGTTGTLDNWGIEIYGN